MAVRIATIFFSTPTNAQPGFGGNLSAAHLAQMTLQV
jgi:hypothetical protein